MLPSFVNSPRHCTPVAICCVKYIHTPYSTEGAMSATDICIIQFTLFENICMAWIRLPQWLLWYHSSNAFHGGNYIPVLAVYFLLGQRDMVCVTVLHKFFLESTGYEVMVQHEQRSYANRILTYSEFLKHKISVCRANTYDWATDCHPL